MSHIVPQAGRAAGPSPMVAGGDGLGPPYTHCSTTTNHLSGLKVGFREPLGTVCHQAEVA